MVIEEGACLEVRSAANAACRSKDITQFAEADQIIDRRRGRKVHERAFRPVSVRPKMLPYFLGYCKGMSFARYRSFPSSIIEIRYILTS
jgi:hypothetical protein